MRKYVNNSLIYIQSASVDHDAVLKVPLTLLYSSKVY